jgi:hypothetical protein
MNTEMNLLSDEELDAVSGGDKATDAQVAAENKQQLATLQAFNKLLNEIM